MVLTATATGGALTATRISTSTSITTSKPGEDQDPTTNTRFIGWVSLSTGWSASSCDVGQSYAERGSYFGCPWVYTGCQSAPAPTISPDSRMLYGCTLNQGTCITFLVHNTSPAPSRDGNQKTALLCASKLGDWEIDLYRVRPTTPSANSAISTPTPSSTSSDAATSQTSQPSQPSQSTSPGVIAGATIGGVALFIILAFVTWFFAFHRRKARASTESEWQQPPQQQIYEADPKYLPREVDSGRVFEAQSPSSGVWAHQNIHEIGELPTHQYAK